MNEFHFADPFHRNYGQNKQLKLDLTIKEIPWIGRVVMGETSQSKRVIHGSHAIFHRKDGLLTLLEDIVDLTIFFYRGDSSGEGGSGQFWQGPVLLDYVLMRIQDGGLFCADESNGCGLLFNQLRNSNQVNYRNLSIFRLDTSNLISFKNLKIWQVIKRKK